MVDPTRPGWTALAAADPAAWGSHDLRLLLALLAGIAVIVLLISWLKLHPFLSLALGSATVGVLAGSPIGDIATSFTTGLGHTVGEVGLLVALGAMVGKLLSDTGGADEIVETVLRHTTQRRLPWAMVLVAGLLGLPMFFEVGVVLLVPVVLMVARRAEQPLVRVGVPALAGLSVLHGLVPPHPGPLAAVSALHVDVGVTLGIGILVAIPTAIVAGPLYAQFIAPRVPLPVPQATATDQAERSGPRPGFGVSLTMLLLPAVLMLGKSVAQLLLSEHSTGYSLLNTIGTPVVALMVTVLVAIPVLGRGARMGRNALSGIVGKALPPVAGIILIVGAGGGFKKTLATTGVNHMITDLAGNAHLSPVLLAWLIAMGLRVATGSATVATISAAGMVAPLVIGLSPAQGALVALAVGSGSLFLSHVNDAGFWLVKEYFGMTVGQTLKTWSALETILSVVSFAIIAGLSLVL